MSLPREILDQLLSGYMDDALSADERARVERLLETDAEVARELSELQGMRGSLRDVSRADSFVKLPEGFSDRVLDAAIACARSEGLSEDHPLVRLAEQPSTQRAVVAPSSPWRLAGVLVALAASIVIAVFVLRPNPADGPTELELAITSPSGALAPDQLTDPGSALPDPTLDSNEMIESVAVASDANDSISEPPESISNEPMQPETSDAPREAIVVNDLPKQPSEMPLVSSSKPARVAAVGDIFVLSIRRTELGKQTHAVQAAMDAANIGAASKKQISKEIVGLAKSADNDGTDNDAIVLYLQASAKSLDQFILKLVADEQGIESVGFSIAQDAPILGVVNSLRVDPTTVKHATTWQLSSESDDWVGAIADTLGSRAYVPIDRGTAEVGTASAMSNASATSNGADVISPMLVLIR